MKSRVKLALIFVCMVMTGVSVKAQVTIGSDLNPVKGALLDLKDRLPGTDSVSVAKGGLVLSRVQLVDRATLQPFIGTGDTEWNGANRDKTEKDHTGLMVYNLTDNADFQPGIYVWCPGWKRLNVASEYVYVPSFNLPWNGTSFDIYGAYRENFQPADRSHYVSSKGTTDPQVDFPGFESKATNFYYVVTDYDPAVLTISGISDNGVMTYQKVGNSRVPPKDAYINVVMIKK